MFVLLADEDWLELPPAVVAVSVCWGRPFTSCLGLGRKARLSIYLLALDRRCFAFWSYLFTSACCNSNGQICLILKTELSLSNDIKGKKANDLKKYYEVNNNGGTSCETDSYLQDVRLWSIDTRQTPTINIVIHSTRYLYMLVVSIYLHISLNWKLLSLIDVNKNCVENLY